MSEKCKNYKLCQKILPEWWSQYKSQTICTSCDILFGTWGTQTGKGVLEFIDVFECPICFETSEAVSYPNCSHFVCMDCFKRSWYGKSFPPFPIPDIYDDYLQDPSNTKWDAYLVITKWKDTINEIRENKYQEQNYLRKCPICRL